MARSEPPPKQQRAAEIAAKKLSAKDLVGGEQALRPEREAAWDVDCETEDTFLFASITNISQMGIFLRTDRPLAIGTIVKLSFEPRDDEPFTMRGRVQWINRLSVFGDNINPGMGIMFLDMNREDRERLVAAIRTIAYLRGEPPVN